MSYVVRAIDHDCAIVPYASQKSTVTGQLLPDVGYAGQTPDEIGKLDNYRHLRDASNETRTQIFGSLQ